jgi:hypothetical protein
LREEAARREADDAVMALESRAERVEHKIQLIQHDLHIHDEKLAGLMYSPARTSSMVRSSSHQSLSYRLRSVQAFYDMDTFHWKVHFGM